MFGPIQYPGLAASTLSSQSQLVYETLYQRPLGYCGYIHFEDSEDLSCLLAPLCGTSHQAASVVGCIDTQRVEGDFAGISPAFATTWRSACKASVYFHTLTSLLHRHHDRGALSGKMSDNPTATPAQERRCASTPEFVPQISSCVCTMTGPCWASSPLWPRKRISMMVAW